MLSSIIRICSSAALNFALYLMPTEAADI